MLLACPFPVDTISWTDVNTAASVRSSIIHKAAEAGPVMSSKDYTAASCRHR